MYTYIQLHTCILLIYKNKIKFYIEYVLIFSIV